MYRTVQKTVCPKNTITRFVTIRLADQTELFENQAATGGNYNKVSEQNGQSVSPCTLVYQHRTKVSSRYSDLAEGYTVRGLNPGRGHDFFSTTPRPTVRPT